MISAWASRRPSPHAAVLVRVMAFVVAAASVVAIPAILIAAATGHGRVDRAFEIVTAAALLTMVAAGAARRLDPLRR